MRAFCYISYGFQDTPFQARKTEDGEDKSVHKRHLQLMKKECKSFRPNKQVQQNYPVFDYSFSLLYYSSILMQIKANGFLYQLQSSSFLLSFQILLQVFQLLREITLKLQMKAIDVISAFQL